MNVVFTRELWLWEGEAAWHFISVPVDVSEEVRETQEGPIRGFGAVRIEVTIGTTTWRTSMFPDSKRGCYLLPVKQAVRKKEGIAAGDSVDVSITVLSS